ncbi:MAG: type III polyketide synthase [Bacteroidia bacterium]
MPALAAISKVSFPYSVSQEEVKECARSVFASSFPQVERMLGAFDNTEIVSRNFCKPLSYYTQPVTFTEQNKEYVRIALEYSIQAIESCLKQANTDKSKLTDILFVSTTGLATPGIDALIINSMKLNPYINRGSLFGLGCAGGVAGFSKACVLAKANPEAVVLLVAVELCSLTFLRSDYSKSNFIGSSLFADGVSACLITGDSHPRREERSIEYVASQSKLYYDTLDVMGWEFRDDGFKVLFSKDIPTIIGEHILNDITVFLKKNGRTLPEIKNFIFHPGGKKVLSAYAQTLPVEGDFLKHTREVMNENGNMSSPTVLYVLERFFEQGFTDGYGLMLSMGPGFSSEMVLLNMNQN